MNWSKQARPVHFAEYDPDAVGWVRPRERDPHAPIPCGYRAAINRALELRETANGALTYRAIGIVMAQYHGWHRSPAWWRDELRAVGATRRPRGLTLVANRARARATREPSGLAQYLAGTIDGPGGRS